MRPGGSRRDALSLGQAGQRQLGGPGLDEYQLGNLLRLRSCSRHGIAEPEPVEWRGRSADHGDDDARDPGPHERGHQGPKSKPANATPLLHLVPLPSWTMATRFAANPSHGFQVWRHSRRDVSRATPATRGLHPRSGTGPSRRVLHGRVQVCEHACQERRLEPVQIPSRCRRLPEQPVWGESAGGHPGCLCGVAQL